MSEAHLEPEDESTFDVDAWLTEAKPPQRAVTVYGRGDLLSALQALEAEPEPPGEVMGGSRRVKEIRRLRAEIDASRRVLHVRALLQSERAALAAEHSKPSEGGEPKVDELAYEVAAYSASLVEPLMSVEQVKRLHDVIGEAQWALIGSAIEAASTESVDIPLRQLASAATEDS